MQNNRQLFNRAVVGPKGKMRFIASSLAVILLALALLTPTSSSIVGAANGATLYYIQSNDDPREETTQYYLNTIHIASDGTATFGAPKLISGINRRDDKGSLSYISSMTQLQDGSLLGIVGNNGWARIFTISAADIADGEDVRATMGGAINTTIEGAFTGCDGAIYLGDSGSNVTDPGGSIIRLDPATLHNSKLGFTEVVKTTETDIDGLGPGIVDNKIVDSPGYALDSGKLLTWDFNTGAVTEIGSPGVNYELHALGGEHFDDGQARLFGLQAHPFKKMTIELREINLDGQSSKLVQKGPNVYATGLTGPLDCTVTRILSNQCQANVAEFADYRLVYHLAIPVDSDFDSNPAPYDVDNSTDIASYDRVAYCLQLDDKWVWVSMDDFTDDIIAQTGVPVASANPDGFQQKIENMAVESDVPGVVTGENIDTGNIEFWNNCYFKDAALGLPGASDAQYDFDDTKAQTANYPPSCYGSMQVHNYGAQQTVFAYNQWDDGGNRPASDLGIGNNPSGEPDWTFAANADAYKTRDLWVYVREVESICEIPDAEGVLRVFADTEEGTALSGVSTVEFIMDGSFSMVDPNNKLKVGPDKDSLRLDIARDAMKQVASIIGDDTNVALRVFGEDGTCDSKLTIPVGPLDKNKFSEAIDEIKPEWKEEPASFIAGSLREAANDLKDVDGQKILVLITDGAENCVEGDEAAKDAAVRAALEELKTAGIDVRLNIVGFAVADDALKQKFIRWAGILGGNYYDATNAAALSGAIKQALGVPYQVTNEKGQLVAQGTLNGSHKLPTGQYTVRVLTNPPIKVSVSVFGGQVTKVGVQP